MKTLKSKVIVTSAIILVASMVLSTVASVVISRQELTRTVKESMLNLVQATAFKIQDVNNQEYKMLESFAMLPYVKDKNVDLKDKWSDLNAIVANDNRYIGMGFYDEHGVGWTTTGKYQDLHERGYLKQALNGSYGLLDPAYSSVNGKISTFYAVPVYDTDGSMSGVAVAVVDSRELCDFVKNMDLGNGATPVIISMASGNYIASSDEACLKDGKNISEDKGQGFEEILSRIRAGYSEVQIYKDSITNKKNLIAYTPVGGDCDWAVLYELPYSSLFAKLNQILLAAVTYLLVFLVLGCLIMFIIITKLLKPLRTFNKKMIENTKNDTELDLTTNVEVKGKDEISTVISNYNKFNERLRNVIIDITDSKDKLSETGNSLQNAMLMTSNGINDILNNINMVAGQIGLQSDSVNDTSEAVSKISDNIFALGQLIEEQSSGFSQASCAIEEMIANIDSVNLSVEKMAREFETILSQINESSKKQDEVNSLVVQVAEQSEMLNEANSVIAAIAEQTNLLAMNAAIEAAHAGEAGKGFSVVADEIRKLSENSGDQSKTIGDQLRKISLSIANVVEGSNETREAFISVSNSIQQTNELVLQIRGAMAEQAVGSKQITDVLSQMNDNTKQVKIASDEMEAGNGKILQQVSQLQSVTDEIKTSVESMTNSAKNIEQTGSDLDNTSEMVSGIINKIGNQIDKFHV